MLGTVCFSLSWGFLLIKITVSNESLMKQVKNACHLLPCSHVMILICIAAKSKCVTLSVGCWCWYICWGHLTSKTIHNHLSFECFFRHSRHIGFHDLDTNYKIFQNCKVTMIAFQLLAWYDANACNCHNSWNFSVKATNDIPIIFHLPAIRIAEFQHRWSTQRCGVLDDQPFQVVKHN